MNQEKLRNSDSEAIREGQLKTQEDSAKGHQNLKGSFEDSGKFN